MTNEDRKELKRLASKIRRGTKLTWGEKARYKALVAQRSGQGRPSPELPDEPAAPPPTAPESSAAPPPIEVPPLPSEPQAPPLVSSEPAPPTPPLVTSEPAPQAPPAAPLGSGAVGQTAREGYLTVMRAWCARIERMGGTPLPDPVLEIGANGAAVLAEHFLPADTDPIAVAAGQAIIPVGMLGIQEIQRKKPAPITSHAAPAKAETRPTPAPLPPEVMPQAHREPEVRGGFGVFQSF